MGSRPPTPLQEIPQTGYNGSNTSGQPNGASATIVHINGKGTPMRFILNWLLTSIAIAIATFIVPGIQPFGMADAWVCFAFVGLFLGFVNSLIKPFISAISLPLTIVTLGIFQLVVNSFMLELASYLSVNILGAGISIASFGSALMGSIIVSIMCSILGVATK